MLVLSPSSHLPPKALTMPPPPPTCPSFRRQQSQGFLRWLKIFPLQVLKSVSICDTGILLMSLPIPGHCHAFSLGTVVTPYSFWKVGNSGSPAWVHGYPRCLSPGQGGMSEVQGVMQERGVEGVGTRQGSEENYCPLQAVAPTAADVSSAAGVSNVWRRCCWHP